MRIIIYAGMLAALWLQQAGGQSVERFYYAYYGGDEGGLAELTIDPEAGKIALQRKVFHSPGNPKLERLVHSPNGKFCALSNTLTDARSVYILQPGEAYFSAWRSDLPQRADYLTIDNELLVAVGHKGALYQLELQNPGVIKKSVDVRKQARVKGGALGKAVLTPDGKMLALLVDENDDDGASAGGRILLFSWPDLKLVHDIQLPKDQPQLHYSSPSSTQRNPMPVDIVFFPHHNTVTILLELYGAVAFCDLDGLLDGKLSNYQMLPTSKAETLGDGFPTSLFPVEIAGRQYVVADNSGGGYGATLFDIAARSRVAWLDTGSSSLGVCRMLDQQTAIATRAGVRSKRGYEETETSHSEQHDLLQIDFAPLAEDHLPVVKKIRFEDYVYFCHPLVSSSRPLVLIGFFGKQDKMLTLGVYDLATGTLLDRRPTVGVIRGFFAETR